MTPAFVRHGDAVRMQLRDEEVDLLRRLRDELHGVLTHGEPDDPVAQRLFPPAVSGDDEADGELRRLMHDDLLQARLTALDQVLAYLDRGTRHRRRLVVDLVEGEPALVLGVLNDMRLALGARVGFDRLASRDRELDIEDPLAATLAVMDYLAMWQEQLLAVLDPSSTAHYDEGHDDPDA